MKAFINKIDKFLLNRHPLVWNTKLLWMLIIALFLHLIFFILGALALTNVEQLHEYGAKSIFFKNGTVYVSIIISILLLVIWCIQLFKNNAFKNFYPTSRLKLFKEFLSYVIIIFCVTTFFLSYNYGVKTYISSAYSDDKIKNEITTANKAAIFFSDEIEKYTINQKRYPKPFDSLYCEVFTGNLEPHERLNNHLTTSVLPYNDSLPHTKFLDIKYFYYTLSSKEGVIEDAYNNSDYSGFVFFESLKDSKRNYFYKDSIFDVSQLIETSSPSYFNYSSTFYYLKRNTTERFDDYLDYTYSNSVGYNENPFSELKLQSNKTTYQLLNRNNPNEIKKILNHFLLLCESYKIKHNLDVETWFSLVYHPSKFEVTNLIRKEPKLDYSFKVTTANTPLEKFETDILTDYYIQHDDLRNLFSNVETIKKSTPYKESIHFFIWLTMLLATVILMLRTTGLKPLIFSIIVTGVLALVVGLTTTLFAFSTNLNDNTTGYFAAYLSLVLGTIILLIPLCFREQFRKSIIAICVNISMSGFILYVFLIVLIISLHQDDACPNRYDPINNCFNLLTDIGILWSFILFVINLIFLYFYMGVIKNWKGLPEG